MERRITSRRGTRTERVGDEEKFCKENLNAMRIPYVDSLTTRAYETENHLFLFSKDDGHLAWKFNKAKGEVEFMCDCMKRGIKILGGPFFGCP